VTKNPQTILFYKGDVGTLACWQGEKKMKLDAKKEKKRNTWWAYEKKPSWRTGETKVEGKKERWEGGEKGFGPNGKKNDRGEL